MIAPSRRPRGRAGMQQQLDDLHRIVERIDANDAKLAGDGVEHLGRARERSGMGHGRRIAGFGAAELDRDHGLAGAARAGRRRRTAGSATASM